MTVNSRVYVYRQSNSGGQYMDPAQFIIVEAENEPAALDKAKEAGLYLDACRLVLTVRAVVIGGVTSPMNSIRYLRQNPTVTKKIIIQT